MVFVSSSGEANTALAAAEEWNFDAAFATAAGVIPTLVLALVLQKELLPVAATFAARFRAEVGRPSRLLKFLAILSPIPASGIRLTAVLIQPSALVGLAVLAELLALFGVAAPAAWRDEDPGRAIAFVSLGLIAFVVFELLTMLALGLLAVSAGAEREAEGAPGEKDGAA